ncbi:MAG: hypothetical protein SFU91_15295 [Chloroherpetonaceae bacterium]|nr:hypothetical protein [Chloroherpetonaceae bacterium]
MKNKSLSFIALFAVVLLSVGCDADYFPRTGTGDWSGSSRVTVIRAGAAVEADVRFTLRLSQDANSTNFFTRFPGVTLNDTNLAVIPADNRPLSTVVVTGVSGDSTFDVRGRNANVNTFFFIVPARTFSGSGETMPAVSFSGSYVNDNTVEGTLSQSIAITGQPTRVFTSTLRISK